VTGFGYGKLKDGSESYNEIRLAKIWNLETATNTGDFSVNWNI